MPIGGQRADGLDRLAYNQGEGEGEGEGDGDGDGEGGSGEGEGDGEGDGECKGEGEGEGDGDGECKGDGDGDGECKGECKGDGDGEGEGDGECKGEGDGDGECKGEGEGDGCGSARPSSRFLPSPGSSANSARPPRETRNSTPSRWKGGSAASNAAGRNRSAPSTLVPDRPGAADVRFSVAAARIARGTWLMVSLQWASGACAHVCMCACAHVCMCACAPG